MGSPAVAPNRVLLGKYRVEAVLGRGGMGVVVRAHHLDLDEVVAIKLLAEEMALTQETFARFEREAKAAAKLKSEHVVRVMDVGRLDDGMPYMVMELLVGRDLAHLVKAEGPIAASIAANLMVQVCEVLVEAHAHGIVHRDLKPSNIFLTERDTGLPFVKVLDFGIAKAPEHDGFALTRTSSVLGTPDYMSPEQLRSSRTADARSDVWALGISLYEVMEGRRPFTGESVFELCFQISENEPPAMTRTPPAIQEIVKRCLAKRPEDRYQSALELAVALAPFAADRDAARIDVERMQRASGVARPNTPPPAPEGRFEPTAQVVAEAETVAARPKARPEPKRRRAPWLIAVVAIGVAIAAVLVVQSERTEVETMPPVAPIVERPIAPIVTSPPAPPVERPVASPPIAESHDVPAAPSHPDPPRPKRPAVRHTAVEPTRGSAASAPVEVGSGSGSAAPCDSYKNRHGC